MKSFFRDPRNLRYSLNALIPVIVFLTSILAAVAAANFSTDSGSEFIWMGAISLFSAGCSFLVIYAVTQPLKAQLKRAEHLVRFEGSTAEKGQMIAIYDLIEKLIELVKSKTAQENEEKKDIMKEIEKLDYLLPLGYMSLMVAHEVRNPLNTITGMSELIKEKTENEAVKKYVEISLDAARKIDAFTKGLLDCTDNELFLETFDLHSVVEESTRILAIDFTTVKFDVQRGDIPAFSGDRNKIYQAVFNVMKNACEYEKDHGSVGVTTLRDSSNLFVSIRNEHSRIQPQNMETIFKPFFSDRKGGRGIGLFISMRNIRMHGGDINVESGESGTTFTLRLPLKALSDGRAMA
jgi:signal transduction histidine kinase